MDMQTGFNPTPRPGKIALRMDDVGASTKIFERYGRGLGPLSNFLFLKSIPPFKRWGPYRELTAKEWDAMITLLRETRAVMTVGVTAAWVERDGSLIPFPEKYPDQLRALRRGSDAGVIEIANHGLTHCVLEGRKFLPNLFRGNREFHREFWDWLPETTHRDHVQRSQKILEEGFGFPVTTLIPPGNVFAPATLRSCAGTSIRRINCYTHSRENDSDLRIIGNEAIDAFHDKEIVEFGIDWLRAKIEGHRAAGAEFSFVRDL